MTNRTMPDGWLAGVLTSACLTLAFAGLAGLTTIVVERPIVGRMANAAAFSAVGWMTLQLRQRAHVLEPAFGAGGAVLFFGCLQVAFMPLLRQNVGVNLLWLSVLISSACAFSLAWLGALLASGGLDRMPAFEAKAAATSASVADPVAPPVTPPLTPPLLASARRPARITGADGFGAPESQPAPHSG